MGGTVLSWLPLRFSYGPFDTPPKDERGLLKGRARGMAGFSLLPGPQSKKTTEAELFGRLRLVTYFSASYQFGR